MNVFTNTNVEFDLQLFNGCVTVTNPTTGNVQVYEIKTENWGSKEKPNKVRVLYRKDGWKWERFACLNRQGSVSLFHACLTSEYRAHASILSNPEAWIVKHSFEYQAECTCRICGRQLTQTDSIRSGIGPVCLGHVGLKDDAKRFKKLGDKELYGELRTALAHRDWELALLAWGWMVDPGQRTAAKQAYYLARNPRVTGAKRAA